MRRFREFVTEQALVPRDRTQYGSNPGGIHDDPKTGESFYVKHYANPDQGRVEALTGKIYDHMGIKTLNPETRTINGRESLVTKWNPDLEPMHHRDFENLTPEQSKQVGRMYAGAVLTKNWDVVGLSHDNIMRNRRTGDLHSVDHGGAFHFRAQGSPKEYEPDIDELHSLRHNDQASGHVFDHVLSKDPGAVQAGHDAVRNMDLDHVHHLFQNSGLSNWRDLHKNFLARREAYLSR